jgi:hypothetical protein
MERLFRQYEVNLEEKMKNRKEVEKDGVRQAFDNYLRAVMINQTQNHGNPCSAGLPPQLYNLIVAGNLVPIQTSDANGSIVIRYEPRNIADTIAPIQRQNGNDHIDYEIFKLLDETYSKRTEILMKVIEAMRSEEDMKRLPYLLDRLRTTNTEEERCRLDSDRHAVPGKKEEEREDSGHRSEQQFKQRDEHISQEQGNRLFASISDTTTERISPLFSAMLQGQGSLQMTDPIKEALRRLMGQSRQTQQAPRKYVLIGQSQLQYIPPQDPMAQQINADNVRMIEDQKYINEIRRMQEAHKREMLKKYGSIGKER